MGKHRKGHLQVRRQPNESYEARPDRLPHPGFLYRLRLRLLRGETRPSVLEDGEITIDFEFFG